MSPKFQKLYSDMGRPPIAPERLLRSLLLQIFHSVGSERMLIEQLQYNLLFRWFVGMEMGEVKNIDKPVVCAVRLSRLTCPPQDHANNSPLSLWGQRDGFVLSIIRHQRIGMIEPYQSRNQQTPFRIPSQYNLAD